MILVDTNVVSELLLITPTPAVSAWFDSQAPDNLHTPSITLAEMVYGLRIMPRGRRRDGLRSSFDALVESVFQQRVFSFDEDAARIYADVMGARKEMGRPMSIPDGQIAAIARANHTALATRNVKDFEDCGLELINPFTDTP